MKTVIYADILFVINFLMNYILLRACSAFLKTDFSPVRFLLASLLGGSFSLIILVEGIPDAVVTVGKILFLILCIFVAFPASSFKEYIRYLGAFFAVNVIFAGVMAALCFFVFPNAVIYTNGIAYFDIDILTLTVISIISYGIVTVISKVTSARAPQNRFYDLEFECDGKSIMIRALYDTGNSLRDSFSGRPVIIVAKSAVMKKNDITDFKNYRLIPYSSLGGAGLLEAFNVDAVTVKNQNGSFRADNVYIALTEKKIFGSGFSALLGTPVFEQSYEKGNEL